MTKKIEKTYTFWSLIENYSIEIPIIQRDYVQGRKKEERIRTTFLKAINDYLLKNRNLHLDFIYGVLKNDKFIPLDGQQRLTTLFLIHYFLSLKENKFDIFQKHLIHDNSIKFSYETRKSSMEFCNQLINNHIGLRCDIKEKSEVEISKLIKNKNWFFSKWIQDPTISSMLIMLDEIQNIFKDDGLFKKLISNELITFSFLEPEKLKIKNENELYIKMNSRGKPLNEFENFKSYFMGFLDEHQKLKFDNDWFEIFWSQHSKELKNDNIKKNEEIIEENIFGAYLNFFENITPFFSETKEEQDILKFNYNYFCIKKFFINKPDLIMIKMWQNHLSLLKKNIHNIEIVLDCLIDYKDSKIYEIRDFETFKINIFQDFLLSGKDLTYEKRARFYALMLFFIKIGKANENEELFKSWMRVSLNIIHNTIFDKNDDFIKLLNLLDNLSEYLEKDFYQKLANSDLSNTEQFKEEKEKARYLVINKNVNLWNLEDEFIKAENHWYLDGQIGFLIDYAKWNFNDVVGFNDFYEFFWYRDTFKYLWDFTKDKENKSIKKNEILIQRALLTFGDYTKNTRHNKTNKFTFCTFGIGLREKNENWRRVFGKAIFKDFLDYIKPIDNISTKLNDIINSYKFDCNDWKSYFINPQKDWSVLDETKHYQIEKNNNIIDLNRGKVAVTGWGWSKKYNLYSYYLYRHLRYDLNIINNTKFTRIKPFDSTKHPGFYIDEYKTQQYHFALDIFFLNSKFLIRFFDRNKNELPLNVVNHLKTKNFEDNKYPNIREYGYWNDTFTLCEMEELSEFLKDFTKELNNL